ncbi:UNVERIFIED_CONTAM: hypothetical protein Slati_0229400 [Sesamum latifolium]|uniref:Retrotransposon gag protein n=1 Tax=Sesamum latifolium TaxID=2727402 RepID=A0AAW2YCH8_9LAMI
MAIKIFKSLHHLLNLFPIQDTRTSIQNLENQTRSSIQNLESQVSQLASSISRLESQGKLPSQTIINPKQNVSAITLCSEKELQFKNSTRRGHARQNRTGNSVVRGHAEQGKTGEELETSPKQAENSNQVGEEHPKVFVPKPPFPKRFFKSKKEEEEKEILETLRKVEVNIPLLDTIKQVPRYAKFLKEMCINKSKLRGNEKVSMGENVSTILQSKLPPKCKDPGRPFLKTSRTKIDVDVGILSMEFDNQVVSFYIDGVTQNSNDMHSIFLMDFIHPLVQGNAIFDGGGPFKMTINKSPTLSPRTYKNKVFHEKISSRKKSSIDRQVLLNPHHHRVHFVEEVDLERPTHLS